MITMGKVDTSDLMIIITWAINIFFQSPELKWVSWTHTTPYSLMTKVIERTCSMLDTPRQDKLYRLLQVFNACEHFWIMLIMGGSKCLKQNTTLRPYVSCPWHTPKLCNIRGGGVLYNIQRPRLPPNNAGRPVRHFNSNAPSIGSSGEPGHNWQLASVSSDNGLCRTGVKWLV